MNSWIDFTDVNEDVEKIDHEYVIDKANYKKMYGDQSNGFSGTLLDMNMADYVQASQIK